jgi:hypothetical protein
MVEAKKQALQHRKILQGFSQDIAWPLFDQSGIILSFTYFITYFF